jgi:hypothetical protein
MRSNYVLILFVVAHVYSSQFSALIANVGTVDEVLYPYGNACPPDPYHGELCSVKQEQAINKRIAELQPHLIMFQELTAAFRCESQTNDTNLDHICVNYKQRKPLQQIQRALGTKYQIACDSLSQYVCIAVLAEKYELLWDSKVCQHGSLLCMKGLKAAPKPEYCAKGSTSSVSTLDIRVKADNSVFQFIALHTDSISNCPHDRCLLEMYRDGSQLIKHDQVMIGGDMNNDFYRFEKIFPSASFWRKTFSNFKVLNPFVGNVPIPSHLGLYTLDFVIVSPALQEKFLPKDFACDLLGVTPGTVRLDDPVDTFDHRALFCHPPTEMQQRIQEQADSQMKDNLVESLVKHGDVRLKFVQGTQIEKFFGTISWNVTDLVASLPVGVPLISKHTSPSTSTHLIEG